MSRIGKQPIKILPGVNVSIDGQQVTVKGNKGELSRSFAAGIKIIARDGQIEIDRSDDSREQRSLHGLSRTLLNNMVVGVTSGFERMLEISGVGYRAQKNGETLVLQVGFNHPIEFNPPTGISIVIEGANRLKVVGIDKEMVGEVAAQIRHIRKADPYKGKGIKYVEEKLKLKPGKAGKATAKK